MSSFARLWLRFWVGVGALLLVLGFAGHAWAYPGEHNINTGIPTAGEYITSTQGACTGCHAAPTASFGAVNPILSITSGGTNLFGTTGSGTSFFVKPGATANFKLTFNNNSSSGGFLVFHDLASGGSNNSQGTLKATSAGTHACPDSGPANNPNSTVCPGVTNNNTEVMHAFPQPGGSSSFSFGYTAPNVCSGTFAFDFWVNSENGDSNCTTPDSAYEVAFTISIASCDDGNACNGSESCNAVSGTCQAGTAVSCNSPGFCHTATGATCNQATGACTYPVATGQLCDDGDPCTSNTTCSAAAACIGGSAVTCGSDGNPCTSDACTPGVGCNHPALANNTSCSDNNVCNGVETCQAGTCTVTTPALTCTPDSNPCTSDSCDAINGCVHPNLPNNTLCNDDNNVCNGVNTCQSGTCTQTAAPLNCNNNSVCSIDSCDAINGCQHSPAAAATVCHAAGLNGKCDGARTCGGALTCPTAVAYTPGVQCSNPSCTNTPTPTATPPGVCVTGNVNCPAVTPQACSGGLVCDGNFCGGGCSGDDSKCVSADFCNVNTCQPKVAQGQPCVTDNYCQGSNVCADGVCCDSACGGSDPTDCQACNLSGKTGTCSIRVGQTCRSAVSACDQAEVCQAGDPACPADAFAPSSTVCHSPTNLCDQQENCTGTSTVCPPNQIFGPSHQCRAAAAGEACDVPEFCTLGNTLCPADGFAPSTQNCTPAACANGTATQPASCPGSSGNCPAVVHTSCAPYLCSGTACGTTCNLKSDCSSGNYCDSTHHCAPEIKAGGACSAAEQCASPGLCVDGRCCNQACLGQCQACDVPGKLGICSPITDKVPHGARTKCEGDGTACQGVCDGANTSSCALPGSTTPCRAPTCTNGVATLAASCQGNGSCPALQTQDCAPGICQAASGPKAICVGSNGTPCTVDVECQSDHYCSAGLCVPKIDNGTTCAADTQCASGHCIDGLCCDSICDGECEACDVGSSPGKCTAVTGAPHKGRAPCLSDPQYPSCAGECDGKNRLECTFPGAGTSCRDATCIKDVATLPAFCTGTGTCSPVQQQDCQPPNGCNSAGTICDNGCVQDRDCGVNKYCSGGVCVPVLTPGSPCSTSSQCAGACVDGFCCNRTCDHQCEACDIPTHEGTCMPVTGAPHGLRESCATDGTKACVGQCNGKNADACTYPGSTVQCSAGSCSAGVAQLAESCDGAGSCPAPQFQVCGADDCQATPGTQCAGACATSGTCPSGQFCSAGECITQLPPKSSCSSNAQCAGGNCVDGFCCDSACTGQCQACDVAGSEGICTTVKGDLPHGGRAACAGSGACGSICDGTSPVQCTYAKATVSCGKSSCSSNGQVLAAPLCNGAGACLPSPQTNCGEYTCDPASGACLTSCILPTDCAPGTVCVNAKCVIDVDGGIMDGGDDGSTMMPDGSLMTDASTDAATDAASDGAPTDSGMAGAPSTDAGLVPPGHSIDKGSCGCRVAGGSSGNSSGVALLAGLALLGAAARRRRKSAERAA